LSVFGEPAYPTIESKAAHLIYFVIKNHPFSDGNKRIGSFLFVDFLNRNARLFRAGEPVINDVGLATLATLALLVAESDPKDKEVLIRLIMNSWLGWSKNRRMLKEASGRVGWRDRFLMLSTKR
jgi:hypothetical protein